MRYSSMIWITSTRHVKEYQLWVRFNDATEKIVDLRSTIFTDSRPIFSQLKDPVFFKKVKVNTESDTIEWPNGVDIAPEVLYAMDAIS